MDKPALDADFAVHLEEVFGPRHSEFSDVLRGLLREMWVRGIEFGTYVKQEGLPLPDEVVVPERNQPNRAARKKEELEDEKAKLIDMAEMLSIRLETALDASRIEHLEGDDLTKGVHSYMTRAARMNKHLTDLLREAEQFRILEK